MANEAGGGPTPEPIFQALTAYWVSGTVSAAIELGLFGAIAKGARAPAEIAKAIGAPERSTRMLCDALCGVKFLEAAPGGGYALPPVAEIFLDPAKPSYYGAMSKILDDPAMWSGFGRLAAAVRKGGSVMEHTTVETDHEFWGTFVKSSLPLAAHQGALLADALAAAGLKKGARVLDIACGTGAYGFTIAQRDPAARVTAVDAPHVLAESRKIAAQYGVADRVTFLEGDMFKVDLGKGNDAALMTNIYHHFDRATCVKLSRRMRDALAPGAILAAVEFVPDDARKTATLPLLFGMTMLTTTPSGDVYSAADYRAILEEAGFERVEARPTPGPQTFIFARAK